ncbi:MAG: hypothetical protein ACYCTV_02975 [Leptospirales bacterium]
MTPLTVNALVQTIRSVFRTLPDPRTPGNNTRYEIEDAALSAFGVFFLQSPSFFEYQSQLDTERGENNAALCRNPGIHKGISGNNHRDSCFWRKRNSQVA